MSDAKSAIFDRIRRSDLVESASAEAIAAEAALLVDDSERVVKPLPAQDAVTAFKQRIDQQLVVGTTCEEISHLKDLPAAVARFIQDNQIPQSVAVQPDEQLMSLDWQSIEPHSQVEADESLSVCIADFGIAETASVVIHSGPTMPILMSFLPLYQIIAVMRDSIVPYLEDYARLTAGKPPARNTCFITGASGTTDIEGVLVKGAHGPKAVHIVIIG